MCPVGYTGAACQRLACPNECSGRGECATLGQVLMRGVMATVTGGLLLGLVQVTALFIFGLKKKRLRFRDAYALPSKDLL